MIEIKLVFAIALFTFVCGWGIGVFRGLKLAHKATMGVIDEAFPEEEK